MMSRYLMQGENTTGYVARKKQNTVLMVSINDFVLKTYQS